MSKYSDYIDRFIQMVSSESELYTLSARGISPLSPLPGNLAIALKDQEVLILAPHPDDETLMGLLALRLKEEAGCRVTVAPFSLGSNPSRQVPRQVELIRSCKSLGFRLDLGLAEGSKTLVKLLNELKPKAVLAPHPEDGHPTHKAVGVAAQKAISLYRDTLILFQTEYWQPNADANLFVEASRGHVVALGEALMLHEGEIKRNPYHLSFPAWLMDNTRRGSERVMNGMGGEGTRALFGALYRAIAWNGANWIEMLPREEV